MAYGKHVERSVAKLARPPAHPDWELIYRDPLDKKPVAKSISSLALNGGPLWAAPDLVYRHRRSGRIVIVERKATRAEIPHDGWPDMRAQLWCYAQVDEWHHAPSITLVGEIWVHLSDDRLVRRTVHGGLMRWTRGEEPFDSDNAKLWAFYRAKVEALGTAAEREPVTLDSNYPKK